jgi:hypothetical protein
LAGLCKRGTGLLRHASRTGAGLPQQAHSADRAAYLRVLMCVNKRSISAVVSVFACAIVRSPKSCVCVNCIVFSYIYLDNLSPAKVAGYRAKAAQIGLVVDNFFKVFFFNDFNAQTPKCLETNIFRDFLWITHAICE